MHKSSLLAAMGVLLLMAACGGGDSESREKQMEAEAKKHGVNADVELDDNGEVKSVEVKGFGGAKVGSNLDLPDGFPKDIPFADSWKIMSSAPSPNDGFMVQALTEDSVEEVMAAARKGMSGKGWEEVAADTPAPTMSRINFEKDGRMANFNLINNGDTLAVQLLTMKKPG